MAATSTNNNQKILIVEATYYDKITDHMVEGATPLFRDAGYEIERLPVTGVFEVPAACEMAAKRAGPSWA